MGIELTHKNIHINRRLLMAKGEISGFGLFYMRQIMSAFTFVYKFYKG